MAKKRRRARKQTKGNASAAYNIQNTYSNLAPKNSSQSSNVPPVSTPPVAPDPSGNMGSTSTASEKESAISKLAKWWLSLPGKIVGAIYTTIIGIFLGFNAAPQSIPLVSFMQQYRVATLVIAIVLVVITILAAINSYQLYPHSAGAPSASAPGLGNQNRRWFITTLLSTAGFLLTSGLLIITLIQPVWCSPLLCPKPIPVTMTHTQGVHDTNLEVYPSAIESSAFVINADPTRYSEHDLPQQNIAAVSLQNRPPYRIVLGVHSLLHDTYLIIVEQILLVVEQVPPTPRPLNIWLTDSPLTYQGYPFLATYTGQSAGEILVATSASLPRIHIDLAPDEDNPLIVELHSTMPADLRLHIQVRYRVANDPQWRMLTL